MAKIPIPERGQPMDVTYFYQIATAVNDLAKQISSATYNSTTINSPSGVKETVKTSEARIFAGYSVVATNSTVSAGNEKPFSITFDNGFKYIPIVSATAVNTGGTAVGKDVLVVIKNITTSQVDGTVKFNTSGDVSLSVHVIAIGVPN